MKINNKILFLLSFVVSMLYLTLIPYPLFAEEVDLTVVHNEALKGGYQLIDIDELWKLYQNDKDNLVLIDTRQEWEHHAGYIAGSLIFSFEPTWLSRLTNRGALEQFLGPDKNKTFVFY